MTVERSQRTGLEGTTHPVVPEALQAEASRTFGAIAAASGVEEPDSRGGPGLARVPAPETEAFAAHVHEYIREYIAAADQKAGFIFAISSAVLVYLYQQSLHIRWLKPIGLWSAGDLFVFVAMAALFVGLGAAASVVVPRLTSTHRGFVFFLAVAEYESASEYAASIARETGESLTLAILRHVYDLARVARRKYRAIALAVWASATGIGLSFIVLFWVKASA
jgi:hypothetical protein